MTWEYTIRLPHGPTVNRYWNYGRRTGKKYVTPEGKAYRLTVFYLVKQTDQSMLPLRGDLRVEVHVVAKNRRRRDLDNYFKALLDAITTAGVWLDDSQIEDVRIYRTYDKTVEPYLEVSVGRIK